MQDEADIIPLADLIADGNEWHELREGHGKATTILRSISGIISMIASSTLIWMIFRSHDRLSTTYHRLLLGLCISDILLSFSSAHFNYMAPSDADYFVWNAKGNEATCDAQGVLRIAGACSSLLYSCSLNLFYLAIVKYEKSEDDIRAKIEPFLHAVPIISGLSSSITMLVYKNINDSGGGSCWLPVWDPPHCIGYEDGQIRDGFDIPCGRGRDGAVTFSYIFFFITTFFPPVIIGSSLAVIYRSVVQQEKKLSKYGASAIKMNIENRNNDNNPKKDSSLISRVRNGFISMSQWRSSRMPASRSNQSSSQRRAVLHKAMAYSLSYFLAWSFFVIGVSLDLAGAKWPNWVWYITVISNPIQGLFTFFIFIHPRVMSAKRSKRKNLTWCQAFFEALWSKGNVKKGSRSRPGHRRSTNSVASRASSTAGSTRLRDSGVARKIKPKTGSIVKKKGHRNSEVEEEKSEILAPQSFPYSFASTAISTTSPPKTSVSLGPSHVTTTSILKNDVDPGAIEMNDNTDCSKYSEKTESCTDRDADCNHVNCINVEGSDKLADLASKVSDDNHHHHNDESKEGIPETDVESMVAITDSLQKDEEDAIHSVKLSAYNEEKYPENR